MDRLDRILALVRRHRPNLRLVDKHEVRWMRPIGVVAPTFVDDFTTVIGDTVYLSGPVDAFPRDALAGILAHELVHQLDQAEHGAAFYLSYGLAPLPVGRTRRAHWERRAYAVDLMLAWDRAGEAGLARALDRVAPLFAGPAYGWMWAGMDAARAYLAPVAGEVRAGTLQERPPYRDILRAWRGEDGWR